MELTAILLAFILAVLVVVFIGITVVLGYALNKFITFPLAGIAATDNQIFLFSVYSLIIGVLLQLSVGKASIKIQRPKKKDD